MLTHEEKLKIFHDTFVKHSWKYIERQKGMRTPIGSEAMTTPFKDNLSTLRDIPVLGVVASTTNLLADLCNGRLDSPITASISDLFPTSERLVKRILSQAVEGGTISEELQDENAIEDSAIETVLKFIRFLQTRSQDAPKLTAEDISKAISGHNTDFTYKQSLSQASRDTTYSKIDTDVDSLRLDRLAKGIEQIEKERKTQQNTVYFNNVRSVVRNFIGRKEILKQILDRLKECKGKIIVIGGLGGAGKTQTVLQYISLHEKEYNHCIRWVVAESTDSLNSSFREFALALGIYIDRKTDKEIIELILEKLKFEINQSLLIFDNVDKPELQVLVKKFIIDMKGPNQHHVLITTRNLKDYENSDTVEISGFTDEETLLYIKTTLEKSDVSFKAEDASKLARLFDNMPLGLSQSIAHIKNNFNSIEDYIKEYQEVRKQSLPHMMHNLPDPDLVEETIDHKPNIYTTLSMTLNSLSSVHEAIKIIRLCSFLHAERIPIYLFDSLFAIPNKKKGIAILEGYSLISTKLDGNTRFIYIHRIVQEVTRFSMVDEYLEYLRQTMQLTCEHIELSYEVINVLEKNFPLLQHSLSLIEYYRASCKIIFYTSSDYHLEC